MGFLQKIVSSCIWNNYNSRYSDSQSSSNVPCPFQIPNLESYLAFLEYLHPTPYAWETPISFSGKQLAQKSDPINANNPNYNFSLPQNQFIPLLRHLAICNVMQSLLPCPSHQHERPLKTRMTYSSTINDTYIILTAGMEEGGQEKDNVNFHASNEGTLADNEEPSMSLFMRNICSG